MNINAKWVVNYPAQKIFFLHHRVFFKRGHVLSKRRPSLKNEVNPKVWTKNFGVYFMQKKHDYSALLKYMHMLEDGYSIKYIHIKYGIDSLRLSKLWFLYQKEGTKVLHRQEYRRSTATFRHKVVLDIENNGISLLQASIKYGVSASRLKVWLKTYKQGGIEALSITKKRGRRSGMGRPKKVQKPETELERLRRENQELKTENALLKKVKALVEEREARLRAIGRGQSEN
ncbi:MAG: helix-turn-helix domain-containing protein [Bacteroidaceae bacterium]|nr:helix-turn-helix domain-containing protein [Bacteroidaceae bacterium]